MPKWKYIPNPLKYLLIRNKHPLAGRTKEVNCKALKTVQNYLFVIPAYFILLLFTGVSCKTPDSELVRINKFGNNPGNLKMFIHIPPGADKNNAMPLLVVLHGCYHTADKVSLQTGWNKLADLLGFYVLYPQQKTGNNPSRCFSWYRSADTKKDKGETFSIKNMVEYVKLTYPVDSGRVFISGLSAGGAMGVALMASYPRIFRCGAIFAGAPYHSATSMTSGMFTMLGWRGKSPEGWAEYVLKQNPGYTGSYPGIIIYQGEDDHVVRGRNAENLVKQWTSLHHINPADKHEVPLYAGIPDITRFSYSDSSGKEAVVLYKVRNLGHALVIHPGGCINEGGHMQSFTVDKNYHSTYWTAVDFGLIPAPLIGGKQIVQKQEDRIEYSVPWQKGSVYEWTFPAGCSVISGNRTNNVLVNWGGQAGSINVTETDSLMCRKQAITLYVSVSDSIR